LTTTPDLLGVLSRADKRYANRRDLTPAEDGYLEHLAAAVTAHLSGKQRYRSSALATLVSAVLLDAYDPGVDLVEQAQESVLIVETVHTYLLGLHDPWAHRPAEGAA
jgi:hypothetical protein